MAQLGYKAEILARARRVVVKVGSAVLSDSDGLHAGVIDALAAQVDSAIGAGREVVLVTSGAVAAGRARLGKLRGTTIAARQAAAAAGQIELMGEWARSFAARGRTVAQLLLTHEDFAERRRRNNARQTFATLLTAGVIPIVNENDTVSVDEIRLGDNDMLSSMVATLVGAQLLIILTDVAGVLSGDPRKRPDARLIPLIGDVEAPMRGLAESAGPLGLGGMATKLKAARQAVRSGIAVVITAGRGPSGLADVLAPDREAGTLILPTPKRLRSRKHWIAFALRPAGTLILDQGASEALRNSGRSLLASGIRDVSGEFSGGDCVSLVDAEGVELGRGIVNYPAADVLKVKGRRSHEIPRLLGYKVADEIIHRDNLVLLRS
jgi:glutamate 5-kinase